MKVNYILGLLFCLSTVVQAVDEFKVPESLLSEVEKGNAEVAYFIATTFDKKSYSESKYMSKAKEWMEKAATMGYAQAMVELAEMYEYNEGEEDNNEEAERKALQWYKKASEQGHAEAIENIGFYYIYGYGGLEKDCQKAYEWYEKAEAKGNEVAINDHAWSLATSPQASCRNPEKALQVFSKLKSTYRSDYMELPTGLKDTEAAIHASIADFNTAIKLQQEAVEELGESEIERKKAFLERLESYKNRKAWIQKGQETKPLN
jgi:TPR repeat protein